MQNMHIPNTPTLERLRTVLETCLGRFLMSSPQLGQSANFRNVFSPAPLRGKTQLPNMEWPRKCKFPKSQDWHSGTHKALNSSVTNMMWGCRHAPQQQTEPRRNWGPSPLLCPSQICLFTSISPVTSTTWRLFWQLVHPSKHISMNSWDTEILLMKTKAFHSLFLQPKYTYPWGR